MSAIKIWLVLMTLTPAHDDREDLMGRALRMFTIAGAIEDAAEQQEYPGSKNELKAALVSVGYYENRFSRRIHEDNCKPHECDKGVAMGPWQVWPMWFPGHLQRRAAAGVTSEATFYCAQAAASALSEARGRCGDLNGALAGYATGKRCTWRGARRRERTASHVKLWLDLVGSIRAL